MKRGPKPKGRVVLAWSSDFAYAIGLLTADGCLSKDGRHINFTSKDKHLVILFKKCLGLKNEVGAKYSSNGNRAYQTQFGDVLFYEFLKQIGITPAKSKTIASVDVPDAYFIDFLRGYFDGDGTSYSYYDPLFPASYRFYISFASASSEYVMWLQGKIMATLGLKGYINRYSNKPYLQLKYSKKEAIVLARNLYYEDGLPLLRRKYLKIARSMRIISGRRGGGIGRHACFRSM